MEVKLISYQENALELLLYTKNTRLQGAQSLQDIIDWPMEKKLEHLAYMRDTIKSSWEFATYVFEINGVTRAFTHQLVRTRTGSYAQESQRTVDVRDNSWRNDITEDNFERSRFDASAHDSILRYKEMIDQGIPVQKARGVLPTNLHTNIIAKFDLRTLHQMAEVRLCTRTQGEYQEVFKEMKKRVVEVHPWAEDFINVFCVNNGTCCFPRYKECPISGYTLNQGIGFESTTKAIKEEWEKANHEAVPVAKNGMTMDDDCPEEFNICGNCLLFENECATARSAGSVACDKFEWDRIPF